ncbi:hypothetical protein Agub_g9098 [Astrephomene gubernaculifera]|uniref:Uncharacterized protein n=1 Tax=Astrephomene gubernaculifera TaxID=47775 RepID=A0AAD3DSP0_9CHLO|nr:hypothetical protein Agub_g9098 [Astrephomene gubernaculifera]
MGGGQSKDRQHEKSLDSAEDPRSAGSKKLKERVMEGLDVASNFLEAAKPMIPFPGDVVAGSLVAFMRLVSQAVTDQDNLARLQERAVDLYDLIMEKHPPHVLPGAATTQQPQQGPVPNAYKKLMSHFHALLEELIEYAREFSSQGWLHRFLSGNYHRRRYERYAEQLRNLTISAQFAVTLEEAKNNAEMRAKMDEMMSLMKSQMAYVDHSAKALAAMEELGGLDAVMANEDKIQAVADKMDMGQKLTYMFIKHAIADMQASMVKDGDKGFHRIIRHMQLRIFWHTFFNGQWHVPWRLWWSEFPSGLEEVHLDPGYVLELCNMLESDEAKQAFQQQVERFDTDIVSVDELKLAFPPGVDLLQRVRQLIAVTVAGSSGHSRDRYSEVPVSGSSTPVFACAVIEPPLTPAGSSEATPSHTRRQYDAVAKCRLPELDPLYKGRDADAELMVRLLKEQAAAQRGVCLLGGAGLGKSSLAVDVGWRLAKEGACPGGAYFCDLREVSSVEDALMRIMQAVGSATPPTGDDALLNLLAWLRSTSASCGGDVLLVVDNAEDVLQADGGRGEGFRDVMAQVCKAAMVLVTSRAPMAGPSPSGGSSNSSFIDHPLRGVERGPSRELVASLWGGASPLAAADVDVLLYMCRGVPLLLRTCADALAHGRVTLAALKAALTNTSNDGATALHLALASLPLSQQLRLVQLTVFPSQFDEESAAVVVNGDSRDVSRVRAQLAVLYSHGLVVRNVADGTYSLHMAVRTTAAGLGTGLASAAASVSGAAASSNGATSSGQQRHQQYQQFTRALTTARERFIGHVMAAFTEWGRLYMTPDALLALRLARQRVPDFLTAVQIAAAEAATAPKLLELVLQSATRELQSLLLAVGGVLTPTFYDTWHRLEAAANALRDGPLAPCLANFESMLGGEAAHRRALDLRTKVLGVEHPDTISSLSYLASCIQNQSEAEPMYQRVQELSTKVLGEDHPFTIRSINSLANCIINRGKYSAAEPLYRQALNLSTKVLGLKHPDTISFTHNLANCLLNQRKYGEAEPMYKQALELHTKVLGAEHPHTIRSLNSLAICIDSQGNYDEAEPLYRRALDLSTKVLGMKHPDTITSINNLASCINNQHKFSEAEPMYRRALKLSNKVLGTRHPYSITCIYNLARCIHIQGKYGEAVPMYRLALELRTKVLGAEHPNTKQTARNLELCVHAI